MKMKIKQMMTKLTKTTKIINKSKIKYKKLIRLKKFLSISISTVLIILTLAFTAHYFYINMMDNSKFSVSFYTVESEKIKKPVRTVHLTDLHTTSYGEKNADLINRIISLKPDFLSLTGDMLTYKAGNLEQTKQVCKELVKIAPVYYSIGNHEIDEMFYNNSPLVKELSDLGVIVLHDKSITATYNENKFVIGGLSRSRKQIKDYAPYFTEKFLEKKGFHLLLTHFPENFDGYIEDEKYDVALVGHAHGGHTRLPLIGALYTKDQGFFPDLTDGMHTFKYGKLIISRGLSNDEIIPRINNIPELVVVDFE